MNHVDLVAAFLHFDVDEALLSILPAVLPVDDIKEGRTYRSRKACMF